MFYGERLRRIELRQESILKELLDMNVSVNRHALKQKDICEEIASVKRLVDHHERFIVAILKRFGLLAKYTPESVVLQKQKK